MNIVDIRKAVELIKQDIVNGVSESIYTRGTIHDTIKSIIFNSAKDKGLYAMPEINVGTRAFMDILVFSPHKVPIIAIEIDCLFKKRNQEKLLGFDDNVYKLWIDYHNYQSDHKNDKIKRGIDLDKADSEIDVWPLWKNDIKINYFKF